MHYTLGILSHGLSHGLEKAVSRNAESAHSRTWRAWRASFRPAPPEVFAGAMFSRQKCKVGSKWVRGDIWQGKFLIADSWKLVTVVIRGQNARCFATFADNIGLLAVDDSKTLSQYAQATKCTCVSTDNDNPMEAEVILLFLRGSHFKTRQLNAVPIHPTLNGIRKAAQAARRFVGKPIQVASKGSDQRCPSFVPLFPTPSYSASPQLNLAGLRRRTQTVESSRLWILYSLSRQIWLFWFWTSRRPSTHILLSLRFACHYLSGRQIQQLTQTAALEMQKKPFRTGSISREPYDIERAVEYEAFQL